MYHQTTEQWVEGKSKQFFSLSRIPLVTQMQLYDVYDVSGLDLKGRSLRMDFFVFMIHTLRVDISA